MQDQVRVKAPLVDQRSSEPFLYAGAFAIGVGCETPANLAKAQERSVANLRLGERQLGEVRRQVQERQPEREPKRVREQSGQRMQTRGRFQERQRGREQMRARSGQWKLVVQSPGEEREQVGMQVRSGRWKLAMRSPAGQPEREQVQMQARSGRKKPKQARARFPDRPLERGSVRVQAQGERTQWAEGSARWEPWWAEADKRHALCALSGGFCPVPGTPNARDNPDNQ